MGRQKQYSPCFWSTPMLDWEEGSWCIKRGTQFICRNIECLHQNKNAFISPQFNRVHICSHMCPWTQTIFICLVMNVTGFVFLMVSSIFTASVYMYFSSYLLPPVPFRVHPSDRKINSYFNSTNKSSRLSTPLAMFFLWF